MNSCSASDELSDAHPSFQHIMPSLQAKFILPESEELSTSLNDQLNDISDFL